MKTTRYLNEMKEVVFDQEWLKTAPNLELYDMYREEAGKDGLRYDLTVLKPIMLGQEYNKTAGHDHPVVPGANLTYPELYEVLEGEVIFLLQDSENDKIKDVCTIKAVQGDKVIVPPNYEHIMINATDKEAKTANWVCRFEANIYKPFRSKKGFSYYLLKDGQWVKNNHYTDIPELRFEEPNRLTKKFNIGKEAILNLSLDKLEFLKTPQNYEWE